MMKPYARNQNTQPSVPMMLYALKMLNGSLLPMRYSYSPMLATFRPRSARGPWHSPLLAQPLRQLERGALPAALDQQHALDEAHADLAHAAVSEVALEAERSQHAGDPDHGAHQVAGPVGARHPEQL